MELSPNGQAGEKGVCQPVYPSKARANEDDDRKRRERVDQGQRALWSSTVASRSKGGRVRRDERGHSGREVLGTDRQGGGTMAKALRPSTYIVVSPKDALR